MPTAVAATRAPSVVPGADQPAPAVDRRPEGPGWFDSSWDLRAGLQVNEGCPIELGVAGWIEACLQLVGGGSGAGLSLSAT